MSEALYFEPQPFRGMHRVATPDELALLKRIQQAYHDGHEVLMRELDAKLATVRDSVNQAVADWSDAVERRVNSEAESD